MKYKSNKELRKNFKEIYKDEFEDPNESFMDYLLDLIPQKNLIKVLKIGNNDFYSHFFMYNYI